MIDVKKNYLTKRQKLEVLEAELRLERISFRNYWRDLSDFILPRRSRFFTSDVNKGDRRNLNIIDGTASMASRTLSSGLMTGVTSPARPWFKLNTSDGELNQSPAVRTYLSKVEELMRGAFLKSNLYNVLPTVYGDLGTFGTGCIFMESDPKETFSFTCFPIGSYAVATDSKGRVNVFFREFQMTVRQIIDRFGRTNPEDPSYIDWSVMTQAIKDHYEKSQYEVRVDISHFILPNEDYNMGKADSKYKKFKSVYYEQGVSANNPSHVSQMGTSDKFLSEKGYDFFPVMSPRWEVAGEDVYGTNSPGMIALGDVKQLQLGEKRIAGAIDQKVRPSMVGPTGLKNAKASILPGDITYLDEREGQKGFRRLFEIDFDVRELEGKQEQIRQRISRAFYEDLFLMLANTNRKQITAREIDERHEEKLLALGPVLERINQDLLDPLIENSFRMMDEAGLLPEVPEELADQDYEVEYISIMAQAQKLAGIGNIERLVGFTGQVAQFDPSVVQKLKLEDIIEKYGELAGVDPTLLTPKEEMEALKQAQAQAQAQEQQMMQAQEMANTGKVLSETSMDEDTALSELTSGGLG